MTRIGTYLVTAARSLRVMQLPTGEMPAAQWSDGEAYHAPAPLLSTLAYEALAYVDPRSPLFVGRVRDLVPSSFFRDVVSLRWSLRLYIASEEEADGTWQLQGRASSLGSDVSTTACGAAALLPGARWRSARLDRRHLEALRRLASRQEWTPIEAAHALRYLSLAGADTSKLAARVRREAETTTPTTAYAHAVGRALPEIPLPAQASNENGRLEQALRTATLLERQQEGPELDAALGRIVSDPVPPSLWPPDPYDDRHLGSAAVALAINVGSVARLAATPRGERS